MTHIILCYMASASSQFIQAYVIPDDNESRELCLSHEAIAPLPKSAEWSILRNSTIDPNTGTTRLRLLHMVGSGDTTAFVCTDVILPAKSPGEILPMTVHAHVVLSVDDPIRHKGLNYILSSADGCARGLWVVGRPYDHSNVRKIRRFTIWTSKDLGCASFVGDASSISLPDGFDEWEMSFNGAKGRLCFTGMDSLNNVPVGLAVDIE